MEAKNAVKLCQEKKVVEIIQKMVPSWLGSVINQTSSHCCNFRLIIICIQVKSLLIKVAALTKY